MTPHNDDSDAIERMLSRLEHDPRNSKLPSVPAGARKPTRIPMEDLIAFENETAAMRQVTKHNLIAARLRISFARYYQQVNQMIDDPAALERDAVLINRLRQQRDARAAARASRVFTRPSRKTQP